MKPPVKPANEAERLQALERYRVLDTSKEEVFDRFTRIASHVAKAPIALISLIDEDRQWFKSRVGLDAEETPRDISFCGHAILDDLPLVVPDASKDERFADNPLVTGAPHIGFYLGVPLIEKDGHKIGTLCVIDRIPRTLDDEVEETLKDLGAMVVRELELRRVASTDKLTGAFNRLMFATLFAHELKRSKRNGRPLSFGMIDLDHFKSINDTYGHDGGDAVLAAASECLHGAMRQPDTLFRMGGEEFGVLFADCDLEGAVVAAERMREALDHHAVTFDGKVIKVTASIGVADLKADEHDETAMLSRADDALYKAKAMGRNRVVAA